MSKAEVSRLLSVKPNVGELNSLLMDGKITPKETYNYFPKEQLEAGGLRKLYEGLTSGEIADHFDRDIMHLADTEELCLLLLNLGSIGKIEEDDFYAKLFDGIFEELTMHFLSRDAINKIAESYALLPYKNLVEELYNRSKERYMSPQILQPFVIKLLEYKKMTLGEYKKYFHFGMEHNLNAFVDYKMKNSYLKVLKSDVLFGEVPPLGRWYSDERKALVNKYNLEDPERFKALYEIFDWDSLSGRVLTEEFIEANFAKLNKKILLQTNKKMSSTFVLKHAQDFHSAIEEVVDSNYKNNWKVEELQEFLANGVLYCKKSTPTKKMRDILGDGVYSLNATKKLTIEVPYIKGLSDDEYKKLLVEFANTLK